MYLYIYTIKKDKMGLILKNFDQFQPVNENLAPAKSLLLKLAADKKRKKMKLAPTENVEFTEDEKKEILNNPDYIEVRDYFLNTVKKPGLVYPFTYFRMVEGLPMRTDDPEGWSVENLYNKMNEASPMLSMFPLPLGNIERYIKDTPEGEKAFEKLWDDLGVILMKKPIKDFIEKSVGPIRREFTKSLELYSSDPERRMLIDKLENLILDLENLPPITDKETGEVRTGNDLKNDLIRTGSMFKDVNTYPEYRDTYVAFKEFIKNIENKSEGWGSQIGDFITDIEKIAPALKVLHYDYPKKIVVTSARSNKGMTLLNKISNANLCIKSRDQFIRYTSGRLQISINLMDLSKEDDKYLSSMTINPNKTVYDSANRRNQRIHNGNENYIELLKRYEIYSEDIVNSIEKNFQQELGIKGLVETIEKIATAGGKFQGDSLNERLIFYMGNMEILTLVQKGEIDENDLQEHRSLVTQIIKDEYSITPHVTISAFSNLNNGGFFAIEDVDLFKILVGNNYGKEDIDKIVELTEMTIGQLPDFIKQTNNPDLIKIIQQLIDIHPKVMEHVKRAL
jgi:hypothetical protein